MPDINALAVIAVEASDEVCEVTSLALEFGGVLGDLDATGAFVFENRTRVHEASDLEERSLDLVRARETARSLRALRVRAHVQR
jgi:hypothetical protein